MLDLSRIGKTLERFGIKLEKESKVEKKLVAEVKKARSTKKKKKRRK
ncbi:Uncharacterised protein [uncultured archaeon]|nr:Uncharacterised protein [uncultured archaeon]